ncbi:M23 family metallopeptidase [Desulfonatronospira sp.]|uniref:M23 family metallopeptidase n=1 Tax=Desulfonatronospira sp. TaxID=1962951 RepID=UPI0025BD4932|nr:M23 family metallopeptidase [Desulfonatronospira sp.]
MDYYIPSYRKSRIRYKRKRSKKPLFLLATCAILTLAYILTGFNFIDNDNPYPSPQEAKFQSLTIEQSIPAASPVQVSTYENPPESDSGHLKPYPDISPSPVPEPDPEKGLDNTSAIMAEQETDTSIIEKNITISSGDTLMGLLNGEGLPRSKAHEIISELGAIYNPRHIRQGQEITLVFQEQKSNEPVFQSMNLKLDTERDVRVEACPENGLVALEKKHELKAKAVLARAEITSSLYNAAVGSDMPLRVLMQMIRAYSFDVDFQRDIRPGDSFEVLFQEKLDQDGNFVRGGSVLYATLNTRGRELPIYRYETSDGEVDFFNPDGESVRKTLMVTPIDGARLTSGYGMRRHPILGYSRMHPGLDFAAPTGTPIMAAGDGVVEYAGRKGNYGNYIRLRHPNEYHTVYAHLSRFGSGIRRGARVTQGQTIGYVGSTGMSTGPHLHYEVHHRGSHVNPATVDTPPGRILEGEELQLFKAAREDLEALYASLKKEKDKMARLD